MTEERRYGDEEVQAIFRAAAEDPQAAEDSASGERPRSAGTGLTLSDLQEIGREVGIPPERIAAAARALADRPAVAPRRTYLGIPIGVSRSVELARAPTDREWALLVSELRETFQAPGRVDSHHGLRDWSNGNLRASIEPTESGYRLRLSTVKGGAIPAVTIGMGAMLYGGVMFTILVLAGQIPEGLVAPSVLIASGAALVGSRLVRLPAWAREREAQMEYITARARSLLGAGPDEQAQGS